MKTAPCSHDTHAALKRNRAAFDALPFVGTMDDETDDGKPATLVLRNCTECQSTLCVQVPAVPRWLTILRTAECL